MAQAKQSLARATAARLKIVAPFDGIAGIRRVNVGDYLKDGTDIVNIEDIDAIHVDFRLPKRFQSKVRRGQTAQLDIDALPERKYTTQLQAIDRLIDASGRSISLRARVDNRQLQLRSGMFARTNEPSPARRSLPAAGRAVQQVPTPAVSCRQARPSGACLPASRADLREAATRRWHATQPEF